MILLSNVNLPLDTDFNDLSGIASRELKIEKSKIVSAKLHKKSVDARHKNDVHFCVGILAEIDADENKIVNRNKKATLYTEPTYIVKKAKKMPKYRPVIVGFGPAGMFSGLLLAKAGLNPIIIERGSDVDTRTRDVSAFFGGKELNENSNVQFGEGGAGTFSDGKLNTGIKDKRIREVLKTFVKYGAPENILYDAKPHIGTDILKTVVKNIREDIINSGGEVRFNSKLENITFFNNELKSVTVNGQNINCSHLILAIGHSARDTFEMLNGLGVKMEQKPFAVGVRIEHLQKDINRALYGGFADNKNLKAADYKMAVHLKNGRGVYTFCMCPGGEVVNASSEKGYIAVNGMSENARDKENANSALLVGITPDDFPSSDVLAGIKLQREIEKNAFNIGKGSVPVTTVGNMLFGKEQKIGKVKPTVKPDCVFCDIGKIFPEFVVSSIKEAIPLFDTKIKGFANVDAVITAPESRSSSPVRILRNEFSQSVSHKGVYPCGEGAGYAGGITSSAVDGLKCAENVIADIDGNNKQCSFFTRNLCRLP